MQIKQLAPLTKTLRTLLKTGIAITLIAIVADAYQYIEYMRVDESFNYEETLLTSEIVYGVVGITQAIIAVTLGIVFLKWLYRAYKNLQTLSDAPMQFSPGWSIGWYFVPILSLFRPYRAMRDIWNGVHRDEMLDHGVLKWWWGLWLLSNFVSQIAFRLPIDTLDDAIIETAAYAASDSIDLILHIVALTLVTRVGEAYARNIFEPKDPMEFI